MPLLELKHAKGFACRTFDEIRKTPFLDFLPDVGDKRRSPVTQKLILDDLFEFQNYTSRPICNTNFTLAVHRVMEKFVLPKKVKMIHLNDIFQEDLEIWSRSPGLPWKELGYKTKNDIRKDPDAVKKVRFFWHKVKTGFDIRFPDSCAYVRSHICDVDETKVRAVWGYPATVTFAEAMFALPLIRGYQAYGSPIAYGFEPALGGFRKLYNRFNKEGIKYGYDFQKFDKTVPAWLIDIAFDILALNIDFVNYKDHGVAQARAMIHVFDRLRNYFVNTPIRLASGRRFRKNSGIASGSYFTQLIGSICNAIILEYVVITLTGEYIEDYLVMGDDSLIRSRHDLNIYKVAEIIGTVFGMHLNFSKCSKDTDINKIKFLGYQINNGFPVKETADWMASLLYPERPDKTIEDVQNRALGLYYACMWGDSYFANLTLTIIRLRPFDVALPRNMERVLKLMGFSDLKASPPSALEFWRVLMNGR